MFIYCPDCGKSVKKALDDCPYCGALLHPEPATPAQGAAQAAPDVVTAATDRTTEAEGDDGGQSAAVLVPCPVCTGEIASTATTCPRCGHVLRSQPSDQVPQMLAALGYQLDWLLREIMQAVHLIETHTSNLEPPWRG